MQDHTSIKGIALYVRVSSEEQREGQTIDSQIAELEGFASGRGWVILQTYKDDGWSGGMLARPELDRLRDDATKGKFDVVLVNDVDRLARDVTHLGVIKRDLERKGIQLVFRKLPAEHSPMRNLMVNILGSFAEFEKELITDRTRRGRRYKAEVRKQFIGCIPPYGYEYIRKGSSGNEMGVLRRNPEEAAIVREMYKWVDEESLSARRVVERLNQRAIHPRKGGAGWAKSSVLRILRSEVYAGIWHYNKQERFEPVSRNGDHRYKKSLKSSNRRRARSEWISVPLPTELRLVPSGQWTRVQERLDQNLFFSPRNSKHNYFLSGIIRCAGCGARFVGDPSHHKFYYRCLARCKTVRTVKEENVNTVVWNALAEAMSNPDLVVKSIAKLYEQNEVREETLADQVSDVEQSLERLRTEESRILEAYRLGIVTAEQLSREMQKLTDRRGSLQTRYDHLSKTQKSFPPETEIQDSVADFCTSVAERLASMNEEEKQQILRFIVKEVLFDGSTVRIRGVIPIVSRQPDTSSIVSSTVIANTESGSYGRNTTDPYAMNRGGNAAFEITCPIEKDLSKAKEASRANLMKANWALQQRRNSVRDGETEQEAA